MVNTRKKSYIPGDEGQAGEQSDSSTTSTTRRATRRSVGNPQTPKLEVATPTRRSRRLSNSSVESIHNDTPIPTAQTNRRRSIRSKNVTSDSEADDVEVVVIKRRKPAETVEALAAIREDGEADQLPQNDSNEPLVVNLEGDDTPVSTLKRENTEIVTLSEDEEAASGVSSPRKSRLSNSPKVNDEYILPDKAGQDFIKSPAKSPAKIGQKSPEKSPAKIGQDLIKSPEKSPAKVAVEEPVKESIVLSPIRNQVPETKAASPEKIAIPAKVALSPKKDELVKKTLPIKVSNNNVKNANKNKSKATTEVVKKPLPCGADIMRNIPRGKFKSGREWKTQKTNPRYMYQDKGLKMPLEKTTQLRLERKRVKDLENRLKEEERQKRIDLVRRRELNKKREEENARRGEVVQVIRNPNKIKRMKKKQLKLIQKRDTTVVKP